MQTGKIYYGFKLTQQKYVPEADGEVFIFEHEKTKAKVLYTKNNDDNKVFCISFATQPCDSCGTAHIIEHSVLCGSERYPLKDPFVRLLNSSMNTFLNAMTFMDKTMYPVASRNETDFENLIDVYCDAVFNPLMKKDEFSFLQEGWHYEINDGELSFNGIVYNEMKGVYSDPEEYLSESIGKSLFPDTIYAYDSGGDPDCIPDLTYEKYKEFYDIHYHPTNSFIYFYGDTDIMKHLKNLDERFLSKYSEISLKEANLFQKPFTEGVFVQKEYSVDEGEDVDNSYYFSRNYAFTTDDIRKICALNVLVKILFDTDSSLLKKALTDCGIAQETVCDYTTCVRQPYFCVVAKNANKDALEIFNKTIDETFSKIISNGIDQDTITACVNNFEFDLRESDSGNYPKGIVQIIHIMESWLYGKDPFEQIEYEWIVSYLKENATSEFYVNLIKEFIVNNAHNSTVVLSPKVSLNEQKEQALKQKLACLKDSLSAEELTNIENQTKMLKERQNAPDSKEALECIPVLPVSAIDKLPQRYPIENIKFENSNIYTYTDNCSGITYVDFYFDLSALNPDEIPYLDLLCEILGIYATKNYSEYDLSNLTGIYLGDIAVSVNTHQNVKDVAKYEKRFMFSVKALSSNIEKIFEISREILFNTLFNNEKRLYQSITEEISKFEYNLVASAETFASLQMGASFTDRLLFRCEEKGFSYYKKLLEIKRKLENNDNSPLDDIKSLLGKIINAYNADILITCDEEYTEKCVSYAKDFIKACSAQKPNSTLKLILPEKVNEGIIIASNVCYTGVGGNIRAMGENMPEVISVCRKYLRTNYLWENIRVKGGAYGAILSCDRGGDMFFVSYRDPNVENTYKIYDGVSDCIANLTMDSKAINDVIIGTISDLDMPLQVYARGRRTLYNKYCDYSYEDSCEIREKILNVTQKDINDCAEAFDTLIKNGAKCAMAPKSKLEEAKDRFDRVYYAKQETEI